MVDADPRMGAPSLLRSRDERRDQLDARDRLPSDMVEEEEDAAGAVVRVGREGFSSGIGVGQRSGGI